MPISVEGEHRIKDGLVQWSEEYETGEFRWRWGKTNLVSPDVAGLDSLRPADGASVELLANANGRGILLQYDYNATDTVNGVSVFDGPSSQGRFLFKEYDRAPWIPTATALNESPAADDWVLVWDQTASEHVRVRRDHLIEGAMPMDPTNPMAYGAVGDGTTDDLTACQACADYCRDNNRTMHITHDHALDGELAIECNVQGQKRAGYVTDPFPIFKSIHNSDHSLPCFRVYQDYDLSIENVAWDGNGRTRGITASQCDRITIRNCTAINCAAQGIRVDLADDVTVENCHVSGVVYQLTGSPIVNADGIYFGAVNRGKIINNVVEGYERIGIVAELNTDPSTFITVKDNVCRDASNCNRDGTNETEFNAGIWIENTVGCIITGNHVYDQLKPDYITQDQGSGAPFSPRVRGIVVGVTNFDQGLPDPCIIKDNTVEMIETEEFVDPLIIVNAITVSMQGGGASGEANRMHVISGNTVRGQGNISLGCGDNVMIENNHVDQLDMNTTAEWSACLSLDGQTTKPYSQVTVRNLVTTNITYGEMGADLCIQGSTVIDKLIVENCPVLHVKTNTNNPANDRLTRASFANSNLYFRRFKVDSSAGYNQSYPSIYATDRLSFRSCKILKSFVTDVQDGMDPHWITSMGEITFDDCDFGDGVTLLQGNGGDGTSVFANSDFDITLNNCRFTLFTWRMYNGEGSGVIRVHGCRSNNWPADGIIWGDRDSGLVADVRVYAHNNDFVMPLSTDPIFQDRNRGRAWSWFVESENTLAPGNVLHNYPQSVTKMPSRLQDLGTSGTQDYDVDYGFDAQVDTAGALTINDLSGDMLVDGKHGQIRIRGNAGGVTFGAGWDFGDAGAPTLTSDTAKADVVSWWRVGGKTVASTVQGFTW